jgi:hypothetical protein
LTKNINKCLNINIAREYYTFIINVKKRIQ